MSPNKNSYYYYTNKRKYNNNKNTFHLPMIKKEDFIFIFIINFYNLF